MRILQIVLAGLLGLLLLGVALPWLTMPDLRRSGKGREFLMILVTLAILLGIVVTNLLRG